METCAACEEPLLIEIEAESDYETNSKQNAPAETVLDDVELRCGCHFHWECFLDALSHTECPNCEKEISTLSAEGVQQVLCTVRNEGGEQKDFDILIPAQEHAYLEVYPDERKGMAFLHFCQEGDVDAVLHLIKDTIEEDAEEDVEDIDLLRYQGTFEGIDGSGLHVAIKCHRVEVAWLLLVLGSSLEWAHLPEEVRRAIDGILTTEDKRSVPDIRTLKDGEGRTPADLAQEVGGWADWLKSGRLAPPTVS